MLTAASHGHGFAYRDVGKGREQDAEASPVTFLINGGAIEHPCSFVIIY